MSISKHWVKMDSGFYQNTLTGYSIVKCNDGRNMWQILDNEGFDLRGEYIEGGIKYAKDAADFQYIEYDVKQKLFPVFDVYKEGTTTNGAITILKLEGSIFNVTDKVNFYTSLGYTVTNIR